MTDSRLIIEAADISDEYIRDKVKMEQNRYIL